MKRRPIPWGRGRPSTRLLGYAALLAIAMMLSCAKKEPEPDCGCESEQIGFLPETNAQYKGDGIFLVYNTDQYQRLSLYTVCKVDPSWKNSETDSYDYKISGYYKKQCINHDIIPLFTNSPFEISSIVIPK